MIYRRNSRKNHGTCVILAVGALAAIGALTVTKTGKQKMNEIVCKVKGFFNKDKCMCIANGDSCE